jgi:DNA-binding response OmpR family regulator
VDRQSRILIVEDEWLLASELARRLTRAGYDILGPAPSIEDAYALLGESRPDAAILDVQLDGDVTFSIAGLLDQANVPLMFLSGHPTSDFPDELAGRIVLPKPADWEKVLQKLRKMLVTAEL